MKFVLFCDLLRAPASDSKQIVVGTRFGSAAVELAQGEDVNGQLGGLLGDLVADPLPAIGSGFDRYLDRLSTRSGPLFPWVGGHVEFSLGSVVDGIPSDWSDYQNTTPPSGYMPLAASAMPLGDPDDLDAASLSALRHTALADLLSSAQTDEPQPRYKRTNLFQNLEPFVLIGWSTDGRKDIEEVSDGSYAGFRYEAFMGGLASLPAPIPHGKLNLCRFYNFQAVNPSAGLRTLVAAAPTLTFRDGTSRQPVWSGITWRRISNREVMAVVPYDAGVVEIEVRCRAIDLSEDLNGTRSLLDRNTLWVRRGIGGNTPPETAGIVFEDWLGALPERLADAFDVSEVLLALLETDAGTNDAPVQATIAEALGGSAAQKRAGAAKLVTEAVLLGLRDVIGPGCIASTNSTALRGPNGSPAVAKILMLINEVTGGDATLLNQLADKIIADDWAFRNVFRSGSPDQQNTRREEWLGLLAGALGPALDLPQNGRSFADEIARALAVDTASTGAFDTTLIRKVVAAAKTPTHLAAIQVAQWRAAQIGGNIEAWLATAGPALVGLADRGFRHFETLRKTNIDLPWIDANGFWKKREDTSVTTDVELLAPNILETLAGYVLGTLFVPGTNAEAIETSYAQLHGRIGMLPAGARKIATVRPLGTPRQEDVPTLQDLLEPRIMGAATTNGIRSKGWFPDPVPEQGTDPILVAGLAAEAHAVDLQIDRFIVGPNLDEKPGSEIGDLNDDLAGYGILMRRFLPGTAEPWRCLNATGAEFNPEAAYNAGSSSLRRENGSTTVLGPVPVAYAAGMPQAVVTYNNRVIVGDDQSQPPDLELPLADPRILRLLQPLAGSLPDDDPAILPYLAYGAVYEVGPFAFTNQGAMPVDIRGTHPALLKALSPSLAPPVDAIRRFAYLRRTGVGALRVSVSGMDGTPSYHPMLIPKQAKPLAEEILVPADAIPYPATTADYNGGRIPRAPLKLKTALLLADEDGNHLITKPQGLDAGAVTFAVEAPVTTLADFDRWLAFEELLLSGSQKQRLRELRRVVWSNHEAHTFSLTEALAAAEQELANAPDDAAKEVARQKIASLKSKWQLQDPAVSGLVVAVTRVRANGRYDDQAIPETDSLFHPWESDWSTADPNDPLGTDRPPMTLTCTLVANPPKPRIGQKGNTITVYAGPGDVLIIRLFAAVTTHLLEGALGQRRFDAAVWAGDATIDPPRREAPPYPPGVGVKTHRLFAAHAFAVEVATTGLPAEEELGENYANQPNNVVVARVVDSDEMPDEEPGAIRLEFKRLQNTEMDAIGSIHVGSQAWRWTGRPLSPFPFARTGDLNVLPGDIPDPENPLSPAEHAFLWDLEGFAERLDETLDVRAVAVPISEHPQSGLPLSTRIALSTPSRPNIARYTRFRVSATSRYAAAYRAAGAPEVKTKTARWIRTNAGTELWSTDWYRVLRPARLPALVDDPGPDEPPALVPKPGIRALIPLTRALGESNDLVSGVLAVADGAWFEQTGLADWLLAEVEVAHRRYGPEGAKVETQAAEFGADPLVRASGLPQGYSSLIERVPLEVRGPLGHGFDTGTATGLYLNSSFVIRAPEIVRDRDDDAGAWWMGKVAFRRLLLAEADADYWSAAQPAANASYTGTSDAKSPQLSATLHGIGAPGETVQRLTLEVSAVLEGIANPAQLQVVVERQAKDLWTIAKSGAVITKLSARSLDLRILLARRVSHKPQPNDSKRYVWYEILALARSSNGHWFTAWQDRWFTSPASDSNEALQVKLDLTINTTASAGIDYELRESKRHQVSETSEGRWTQFLPNLAMLARAGKVPLHSLSLAVDANGTDPVLAADGNQLAWLGTDALKTSRVAGQTDQGLFNLLLLTKRVASISGADEEAYVGLYHSSSGREPKGTGPLTLKWFGAGGTPKLSDVNLVGRILTVRVRDPNTTPDFTGDPWKLFFPPEQGPEYVAPPDGSRVFGVSRPPDASLQIIEIYAPIFSRH